MKLISNFDQLTKQDIFDMALAHVRKNGKQSMRDGMCCYTGIGCAASVFIDPREPGESVAEKQRPALEEPSHEQRAVHARVCVRQ